MNRRDVLKMGTALSLVAVPFVARRAQAANAISYVSWGGRTGDFDKEFFIKPFTAETGISVEYITGPDLAKARAQVSSNNVLWDVFRTSGSQAFAGEQLGLWEPIDTKIVDPARFIQKPTGFAVPLDLFSGGIAYNPSRVKPVADFAQFWDVKNFPGSRALKVRADQTLEMALLADGVAPGELYPLDVNRAFKALDRIKPYVKKWWDGTNQSVSLVQSGEVDYSFSYANVIRTAKESGVAIDFCFGQCMNQYEVLTVLKGSRQKEAAMRFIEFITRPEQQALMGNKISVGPVTKGAEEKLDEQARHWLPDIKNPKNISTNDEYWANHLVELDRRFKEWILT